MPPKASDPLANCLTPEKVVCFNKLLYYTCNKLLQAKKKLNRPPGTHGLKDFLKLLFSGDFFLVPS